MRAFRVKLLRDKGSLRPFDIEDAVGFHLLDGLADAVASHAKPLAQFRLCGELAARAQIAFDHLIGNPVFYGIHHGGVADHREFEFVAVHIAPACSSVTSFLGYRIIILADTADCQAFSLLPAEVSVLRARRKAGSFRDFAHF